MAEDLLGRKRSRQGRVRRLTGLGYGALRAGFAGLDALVAEEPSDGSEVRHEDDDCIEQGLRDASVRQAELGIVDAVEGGLLEVAVAALVLAAQSGPGGTGQRSSRSS
ncbi:hypothetical protein [Streptomyces cinereospinus]|uniref:Uncharacterized protein n=1 Tax=Streptomyces cinereospinus TaxID=285561 RepID=A0ABV5N8M2_9ACTN